MNPSKKYRRPRRGHLRERLLSALLVLGVALSPVYFLPSGLPQVGDWILAVWVLLTLTTVADVSVRTLKYAPVLLAILLVAYITWVSVTWAILLRDLDVAFQPLLYMFNFSIAWALTTSIRRDEVLWHTELTPIQWRPEMEQGSVRVISKEGVYVGER